MRALRIGIRGKLLAAYALTIAIVTAVEIFAQDASAKAGREFETRLTRYYSIQNLRNELSEIRSLGERYMREHSLAQRSLLGSALARLSEAAAALPAGEDEPIEAFFELRAVRRGIEAWRPAVEAAFDAGQAGREGAYEAYQKADRIASYVDGYLGRLLSISMATGTTRYEEAQAVAAARRRVAIFGLIATGVLALVFSVFFARSIAAPVRKLANAADRMASGDLNVEAVHVSTRDEVADLARDFNAMSANIRALVEGLKEKAELERLLHEESLARISMGRALREAQFMNLQDQVRPHFLFNALNTISRSALLEGASRTELLATSLGKLMRYSLSERGAFTTVGEELSVLREYLTFQGIRFGDRLKWEIRSEPGTEPLVVPRFILQPIVENAVRHGIEPKVEGGRVVVSARIRGSRMRLVVADTGVGIDPVILASLRTAAAGGGAGCETAPGQGGPGIGMANLEERLKYRYNGGSCLAIASRQGRGTVVRISLPVPEGGTSAL
jgi:signal transduction histidine kinase